MNSNYSSLFIYFIVLISIIVSVDIWSFVYAPQLKYIQICLLLFYFAVLFDKGHIQYSFINKIATWSIIGVFLSLIPAIGYYKQPIMSTIPLYFIYNSGLFFYFFLKKTRFGETNAIKAITIVSSIWVLLEILQQFTYPIIWFSDRLQTTGVIEKRLGLWRVYIYGVDFVMIAFSYWLGKIISSKGGKKKSAIIKTIIFLIGLLCYGSRKHIAVVLFVFMLFSLFSVKGNKKMVSIIVLFLFSVILYFGFYSSFIDMNEDLSQAQGEGEDFIRYRSALYYLDEFSNYKLYPLFGSGLETVGSSLHKALLYAQYYSFWQADIGIIGYYSRFGLLGVFPILLFILFFIKNWKNISNWLKYFFIMKVALLFFDFWGMWDVGIMAYGMFLYLLDIDIRRNKRLKYENRHINLSLRS